MREVAPGLHSWTAPHPEWDPDGEPGSSADWPEQVGCVLYEAPDAVALIDPLVPEALWPRLDGLVAGRPVAVLTTIRWHGRSRDAALARYGAAEDLPTGVESLRYPAFGETMYRLPEPRALVPGDNLIGDGAGGVRVCPQSWLDSGTVEELRDALQPLLELPVEHILTSHREAVIGNGQAALARALS